MNVVWWIKLMNEAIPLLLLVGLSIVTYRGIKKNQFLLAEKEDLVRRYLLFRGDKQVRLKVYGQDEKVQRELLRTLSNSWKNFKRAYDQYQASFLANTARTKLLLQGITVGLLINSARVLAEEYYFYGFKDRLFLAGARELLNYVLVFLSFFLMKAQARPYLAPDAKASKIDLETLFFPNQLANEKDYEYLYNEFSPLDDKGAENGEEDQDYHRRAESRSGAE
ncbi:MAG: hypothetical protein EHM36_02725 [Deltaproteobacteria bacterium]|nr:MAG: hypothetical protein EHM36_02725 [Deltaproteobacteria bacterium]